MKSYKHFGDIKALDGVTIAAETGKVLGLLGPNGAGKTTLVRILTTLLKPDSGQVSVGGIDVLRHKQRVREIIGLAGQYAAVDEILTGRENLVMVGRLYHMPRRTAKAARRRAARAVCPDRCRRPLGQDLFRWHAPPTGPGRQHGRPAQHPLPG